MGFDAFLDQEFYEGSEELRNYISDEADYQKLIQVVEAKENPEDKLFIFNVTMQNHGGYGGPTTILNRRYGLPANMRENIQRRTSTCPS